jgi:hypothetical protein
MWIGGRDCTVCADMLVDDVCMKLGIGRGGCDSLPVPTHARSAVRRVRTRGARPPQRY